MNPLCIFVVFLLMRDAKAIVELNCSDNATCIDNMAKEIIQSVRDQRTVRVFDVLTIEPLRSRQARMVKSRSLDTWLETFLEGNSFSFDWNDYTFKVSQAEDSNALELDIYQGRTAKDVSDPNGKISSTKNEEEKEEDKTPKMPAIRRRRHKKKVMQMIIPLLFGMKSAGVVMFAMAVVTVLTLKAFFASKVALLVTAGMAAKRLYESYGAGVGLQNQPYLYSQYPIDFPSASSHAYSVSGVSQQFASPEMYSPTGFGAHAQANEIIHQNDATAQQSQQAHTLLMNSTRAAERWDGKSKVLKFLESVIDGVKNAINPIANIFYGAIPATFRGLNSDVSTTKDDSNEVLDEEGTEKKPRQILVPQPRNIAQRKMTYRKNRPKKYAELKISLEKLKSNKDLHDYTKTKKYKYNYPNTYFYPRVQHFVNPNIFQPNSTRLLPYYKDLPKLENATFTPVIMNDTDWRPIAVHNMTLAKHMTLKFKRSINKRHYNRKGKRSTKNVTFNANFRNASITAFQSRSLKNTGRYFLGFLDVLLSQDPVANVVAQSTKYTESKISNSLKSDAPAYYTIAYNLVMMCLDFMEVIFEGFDTKPHKKKKKIKKSETYKKYVSNCTQFESKGRGSQL